MGDHADLTARLRKLHVKRRGELDQADWICGGHHGYPPEWPCETVVLLDALDAAVVVANPDRVVAALVESGWCPTADQLRAMGGKPVLAEVMGRDVVRWRFPEGVDGD